MILFTLNLQTVQYQLNLNFQGHYLTIQNILLLGKKQALFLLFLLEEFQKLIFLQTDG